MSKRSRERQLAKLAARRQAERAAAKRRRMIATLLIVGAVALVTIVVVTGLALSGENPAPPAASASPSPSPAAGCSREVPKAAGERKPTFDRAPEISIDPSKTYTATIDTSCGTIETELLAKQATAAVNNFVFLARKRFYDGLTWHRLVQGFVIQGGDPKGDGTGGPGYEFPVTVTKGVSFDAAGVLAYAHAATGGNGSQFFITLAPATNLDPPQGKYTIFGQVTSGQNVVDRIGSLPTHPNDQGESSIPLRPVYIDSITINGS
jgi:cyclophilin family peptidyl-prolyl cis-trans isomerase